jgi:hypothetical protein
MSRYDPEIPEPKTPLEAFAESIFDQAVQDPDRFSIDQRVHEGGVTEAVISYTNSFAEISVVKPVTETINKETNPYIDPSNATTFELEVVAHVFFRLKLKDGSYYDARYHQIFILPDGTFLAQPVIRLNYDYENVPTPFESAYHLLPVDPEAERSFAAMLQPE